ADLLAGAADEGPEALAMSLLEQFGHEVDAGAPLREPGPDPAAQPDQGHAVGEGEVAGLHRRAEPLIPSQLHDEGGVDRQDDPGPAVAVPGPEAIVHRLRPRQAIDRAVED